MPAEADSVLLAFARTTGADRIFLVLGRRPASSVKSNPNRLPAGATQRCSSTSTGAKTTSAGAKIPTSAASHAVQVSRRWFLQQNCWQTWQTVLT